MNTFAEQLRAVMADTGLSQSALAEKIGAAPSSVSQYLSGKVEPPAKKKQQIALSLDLDADFFRKKDIEKDIASGYRLPAKTAARLMELSYEKLCDGLRDGIFPFGYAIKASDQPGQWTYWISAVRFTQETGIPVKIKQKGKNRNSQRRTSE